MVKIEWYEPEYTAAPERIFDIDEHADELSELERPAGTVCSILTARSAASIEKHIEFFSNLMKYFRIE